MEDYSTEKFKNVNQIVITAGVKNNDSGYLLSFVENLHKAKARALIINTGKYIMSVPESVTEYCDRVGLPLYTMPWDVLINDVVKDIAHMLMYDEAENQSVTELIQSIIFNTENIDVQINRLSFYGFSQESTYCPVIIKVENTDRSDFDMLLRSVKTWCDSAASTIKGKYVSFVYNRILTLILLDTKKADIEKFIETFNSSLTLNYIDHRVYICVGHLDDSIYNLSVNFKRLLPIINVAQKKSEYLCYYDNMGMYKILSEVSDLQLLKGIYNDTIGLLTRYDAENYTDLTNYIKNYIICDGNTQAVASKFYVHRNTVNNQLRRIKEITGVNPITLEGKLQFMVAIKISELYNL